MSISAPPITPHREIATDAIIIVIKNAHISSFIRGIYVLTFPNINQFTFMQKTLPKKQKLLPTFLHNTIKRTPQPLTSQQSWFGKTVTLRSVTICPLSSVNKVSCIHPGPPQSSSTAYSNLQCAPNDPEHKEKCCLLQYGSPRLTRFKD